MGAKRGKRGFRSCSCPYLWLAIGWDARRHPTSYYLVSLCLTTYTYIHHSLLWLCFLHLSGPKWLFVPVLLRTIFFPLFAFCIKPAYFVHDWIPCGNNKDYYFYCLGILLGFVLGATQSIGRSTYSKLLPDTHDHATYFSFYDVTEKIAIVLGMLVFGLLIALTGSMQYSVLSLAFFFLIAYICLLYTSPSPRD